MTPPTDSILPILPISAVVLTYNSDRTLAHVLRSLQFCDEIVIVDSGSTDDTLFIAEHFSCRILQKKLNGFGEQKDFGVQHAKNDWIFVVDSDEIVSKKSRNEIFSEFKDGIPKATAYSLPVQLYFLGHPIRYSGQQSKRALRLFNRNHARFDKSLVHETVHADHPVHDFIHPLLHYSYLTLDDYFVKFSRYTSLGAKILSDGPRRNCKPKVIVSFVVHFIKFYFLKLGFLDGYHGFLWCLFSALSPVVKYAKYEELSIPGQTLVFNKAEYEFT